MDNEINDNIDNNDVKKCNRREIKKKINHKKELMDLSIKRQLEYHSEIDLTDRELYKSAKNVRTSSEGKKIKFNNGNINSIKGGGCPRCFFPNNYANRVEEKSNNKKIIQTLKNVKK